MNIDFPSALFGLWAGGMLVTGFIITTTFTDNEDVLLDLAIAIFWPIAMIVFLLLGRKVENDDAAGL